MDIINLDDLFLNKKWLLKMSFKFFISCVFNDGFTIFVCSIWFSLTVSDDFISGAFVILFIFIFILLILVVNGWVWMFSLLFILFLLSFCSTFKKFDKGLLLITLIFEEKSFCGIFEIIIFCPLSIGAQQPSYFYF